MHLPYLSPALYHCHPSASPSSHPQPLTDQAGRTVIPPFVSASRHVSIRLVTPPHLDFPPTPPANIPTDPPLPPPPESKPCTAESESKATHLHNLQLLNPPLHHLLRLPLVPLARMLMERIPRPPLRVFAEVVGGELARLPE